MRSWMKIAFCLFVFPSLGITQEVKREYEERIDPEEMPGQVLETLEPLLEEGRKVKYYLEKGVKQNFYEVKLRWKKRQLSVEFYSDGRLMDVEELLKFDKIPASVQDTISNYFNRHFKRHRLSRVQIQYTSEDGEDLIESLMEEGYEDLRIRYEIEAFVKGEAQDEFGPYEFLFDEAGRLIQKRKIVKRSSDNVKY